MDSGGLHICGPLVRDVGHAVGGVVAGTEPDAVAAVLPDEIAVGVVFSLAGNCPDLVKRTLIDQLVDALTYGKAAASVLS